MADAKALFDVVCNCVLECFKPKNLWNVWKKKSISLRKLANGKHVFEIQPAISGSLQ